MKKLTTFLFSGLLLFGGVACDDVEKTVQQAPSAPNEVAEAPSAEEAKEAQEDATSEIRRNQLNSDIRAREQRNNVTGGDAIRADTDLESEVRSKLEANLPASKLSVDAKDGVVTVGGTVPTQPQYEKINTLAREIKGVQDVVVNVSVVAAQPDNEENAQNQTEDNTAQPVINNSEESETDTNEQQ